MVMVIAVIPQKLWGAPKSTKSHCVHNFLNYVKIYPIINAQVSKVQLKVNYTSIHVCICILCSMGQLNLNSADSQVQYSAFFR